MQDIHNFNQRSEQQFVTKKDENIVFIDNRSPQSARKNVKIVPVSILLIALIGLGVFMYITFLSSHQDNRGRPMNSGITSEQQSLPSPETKTNIVDIAHPVADEKTADTLYCANVEIPLPEEWNDLQVADNQKLDQDGCRRDATGCLCAKKDKQGNNIMLSVLVVVPPKGITLESLIPPGATNIDTSNFLGNPAVKYIMVNKNKTGSLTYSKGNQFHNYSLSAPSGTFGPMWADFLSKIEGVRYR